MIQVDCRYCNLPCAGEGCEKDATCDLCELIVSLKNKKKGKKKSGA